MKSNLLNLFGLGKLKFSASISSLLAACIYFIFNIFLHNQFSLNLTLFLVLLLISIYSVKRISSYTKKDPREIVIDEFLGMYLCLTIASTQSLLGIISMFVVFRVVDNLKFWPFSYIEKKLDGKYGFLWDDLIIGAVTGVIYLATFLIVLFPL